MQATYDVFLSHAWADGDAPGKLAAALEAAGIRTFFDATNIADFTAITRTVNDGVANSKLLLAWYSATYPTRPACQCELTAAFLAAQTHGDPVQRVLVINPEPGKNHIHPVPLQDSKFVHQPPTDPASLAQLVQSIKNCVAAVDTPLGDIRPQHQPTWRGQQPGGSTHFVGRRAEMWQIYTALHQADFAQVMDATIRDTQLTGLGGIGKSLLVGEYARRYANAYPGGLFWLNAYSKAGSAVTLDETALEAERFTQFQNIARGFGVPTAGRSAEEVGLKIAAKLQEGNKPCLWIVDDLPPNLPHDTVTSWLSPNSIARTLITTRIHQYDSRFHEVKLGVLTPDEALKLLTIHRQTKDDGERQQAIDLAADLGHHALAIDVTAAALQHQSSSKPFAAFRTRFARQDDDALNFAAELAGDLPNGHEKNIAITLMSSIKNLPGEGRDFLRLAAILATAPIPGSLVAAVLQRADGIDAEDRATRAFAQVQNTSLAEVPADNDDARAVHALVARTVRFAENNTPERTASLRSAAIQVLTSEISAAARDPRDHKKIELQVAHARQVVATATTVEEADLVGWLARHDRERGAYASARSLYESQWNLRIHLLGPEHPNTLISMNNLAEILAKQGDISGASRLHKEELNICRKVLGPEHPDTLTSMNNLAFTLWAQGDLTGARKLEEEVLDIRRTVPGPEHPDTLTSMNNLAETLRAQGDLPGARTLQEETLEIQRRVLGPERPDTLASMNNLAFTLWAQGDLPGARELEEQALEIKCRVLGPEHPATLTSMNNLAETLRAQGDLPGARTLQEETLEIRRRVLGPEHPNTLTSMSNLAETLRALDDLPGARTLQEETLANRHRVLGPEHPDTLTSMSNLALTLGAQGDLDEAARLNREILEIRRHMLSPEHPDTSISAWNLFTSLEGEAAQAVLNQNLLWLLDRDPDTLGANQRTIRQYVTNIIEGNTYRPPPKTCQAQNPATPSFQTK